MGSGGMAGAISGAPVGQMKKTVKGVMTDPKVKPYAKRKRGKK